MTNQEKSRWLVENILGECWHEWVSYISDYPYYHYHCSYCKSERSGKELNIDFFTHQYIREIPHKYLCDIFIPSL